MADEKLGRGRPCKSGTLEKLYDYVFEGVEFEVLHQILRNLENRIFRDGCIQEVYRQFRYNDVTAIERLRKHLQEVTNAQACAASQVSEGGSSMEAIPSGHSTPEGLDGPWPSPVSPPGM